jgi:CspA family cold shock protein
MSSEGIVERWLDNKGYGFIKTEDGKSIFVHYTEIKSETDYKKLEEGQKVTFDVEEGRKGLKAVNVAIVEGESQPVEEMKEEIQEEVSEESQDESEESTEEESQDESEESTEEESQDESEESTEEESQDESED